MHFGHTAIALAAKPLMPKVSLGLILFLAVLLDVLTVLFAALGMEYIDANGPGSLAWSHGLFMSVIWSIACACSIFTI